MNADIIADLKAGLSDDYVAHRRGASVAYVRAVKRALRAVGEMGSDAPAELLFANFGDLLTPEACGVRTTEET